jgi:hypothetical protein
MVVYRYGEHLLGAVLPDDVLVEHLGNALRLWDRPARVEVGLGDTLIVFVDDLLAQFYAFITDVDCTWPRYKPAYILLAFATE